MKTTFEHFKSIFGGNKMLGEFITFLTTYIIKCKAITNNPLRDGYDICFLAFNNLAMQEAFDNMNYEELQKIAKNSSEVIENNDEVPARDITVPFLIYLNALKKFEEVGVLEEFFKSKS